MRRRIALFVGACAALVASPAQAYRPFDGTDGDVAELGSFELELGPAHFYDEAGQPYLIAPATVLNFGILPGTELVIDFQNFVALGSLEGRERVALLDTDVLVKHVFREGILQGKSGLSIAVEAGPLTPEINGTNAFGGSVDAIFSYRWGWGTVHFNEWGLYTREHNADIFSGVIVEGPHEWTVRPVSELFFEHEFNAATTESVLVGAIWTIKESFVLDLGVRGAHIGDDPAVAAETCGRSPCTDALALEVRLGLTWAIPFWEKTENAAMRRSRGGLGAHTL